MTASLASYPLLQARTSEVLFRCRGEGISAAAFLTAVHRVAAGLPDAPFVINDCQHRLWFTIAFAAAISRGQVTLLTGDRSANRLRELAVRYPGLYVLSDQAHATVPVHQHTLAPFPLRPADIAPRNPDVPADRTVAIVFTSGSTGEPVAHHKGWGMLVERSIDAATAFGLSGSSPYNVVGMVPPHHMYGLETTVLLPLHVAVSAGCDDAFYPHDVAAALHAIPAPRILVTTPLQIAALLRGGVCLPAIDRVISATAPLYPDVARAAEQAWDTRVEEIFGATEVGSIAWRRTVEGEIWRTYPRVMLARDDSDIEGGVLVHAPFSEPYPLNDLVEILDASRFRLIGRRTDVIKFGGRRTSLAALNRVLAGIDGVVDGQFVAPHDIETRPGTRLQVFAVAPELDADTILRELRNRIDPLFLPRRVVLVDRLPRDDVGKLTSSALASLRDLSRVTE
jgi:acyl-coenzyme A synthetase/AMP-(fatty) acid ligase